MPYAACHVVLLYAMCSVAGPLRVPSDRKGTHARTHAHTRAHIMRVHRNVSVHPAAVARRKCASSAGESPFVSLAIGPVLCTALPEPAQFRAHGCIGGVPRLCRGCVAMRNWMACGWLPQGTGEFEERRARQRESWMWKSATHQWPLRGWLRLGLSPPSLPRVRSIIVSARPCAWLGAEAEAALHDRFRRDSSVREALPVRPPWAAAAAVGSNMHATHVRRTNMQHTPSITLQPSGVLAYCAHLSCIGGALPVRLAAPRASRVSCTSHICGSGSCARLATTGRMSTCTRRRFVRSFVTRR